ncbi:MAG: hypothetical protein LHW46_07830 [Candidatus Cloacimonetes bacterium]|nr:hypothetical protein [Candidatus Cloacimonadota bacterium]
MKVKFKSLLMGYTGVADDSVIYFSPKLRRYIIRKRPRFVERETNRHFGNVSKHIFALEPTEAYKDDLRQYLILYNALPANSDRPIYAWNRIYSKLMWAMNQIYHVDLTSITREDLEDLPCRSVAAAVEAGLLPKVKDYWLLSALMFEL